MTEQIDRYSRKRGSDGKEGNTLTISGRGIGLLTHCFCSPCYPWLFTHFSVCTEHKCLQSVQSGTKGK